MKSNSSTKRSFVAIVDNSSRLYNNLTTVEQEVLSLADPYTNEPRQYLRSSNGNGSSNGSDAKKSQVYEIQSLSHPKSKEYSSFFLGSTVISNKSLHLVTPIDPLYLLLPYFEQVHGEKGTGATAFKWQPWEQLCSSKNISRDILDCLGSSTSCKSKNSQLRHLFEVNDQYGDDMILFKFQKEKALGWLQKKLTKIELIIRGQIIMDRSSADNHLNTTKDDSNVGAFSSSFRLPEDEVEQSQEQEKEKENLAGENKSNAVSSKIRTKANGNILGLALNAAEEASMHQAAAQIVCEYLSPYWRKELLQSIFPTEDVSSDNATSTMPSTLSEDAKRGTSSCQPNSSAVAVTPPNAGQKRSYIESGMSEADKLLQYTMGSGGGGTLDDEDKMKKKKVALKSVALKRLEKTNTKGMKTMASFFSVKKKKTKCV